MPRQKKSAGTFFAACEMDHICPRDPGALSNHRMAQANFNIRGWQGR
jgi:hypothetical protein